MLVKEATEIVIAFRVLTSNVIQSSIMYLHVLPFCFIEDMGHWIA